MLCPILEKKLIWSSMVKVAIIGSFQQHYPLVREAIETFRSAGWEVTSPAGADVVDAEERFVRFVTDPKAHSDAEIQAVTLERIFQADLVYVIAPNGYVGRTTCYEIGRLMQARRPIYFSAHPDDLPIEVPQAHIQTAADLCTMIETPTDAAALSWPLKSVISMAEDALVQ